MGMDLREALRRIRRRPAESAVVVAVLVIGITASASAHSYLRAFAGPLPGIDPGGVVRVFEVADDGGLRDLPFLDYEDYRGLETIRGLAVAQPYYAASVRLEDRTEVAFIEAVTGNLFPMLGVSVAQGRGLEDADDQFSAPPAAVVSYDWWQTLFGRDPGVLGATIHLNYRPFTVVGVASPAYRGTAADARPDVWISIAHFRDRYTGWDQSAANREVPLARVYGRLAPGATRTQAEAELGAKASGLDEQYPREMGPRTLRALDATWIDPRIRTAESSRLGVMVLAVAGLLALVCANVGNLLFALSLRRRGEMAVRGALGASPLRLLREDLTESGILALIAGGVSFLLTAPVSARLGSYFARPSVWAETVPRETPVDGSVLGFSLLAALAAGVVVGLGPALRARREDGSAALRGAAGQAPGPVRRIAGLRLPDAQDVLVAVQVSLSMVLLVVSGLVVRTMASAADVDPGFEYDRVISSHVSTSSTDLDPSQRGRFFRELSDGLVEEPWVIAVSVKDNALLSGQPMANVRFGDEVEPASVMVSRVMPGFFGGLGIEVLAGRPFVEGDSGSAHPVAVLNRRAAVRFFGNVEATGRTLQWPADEGAEGREYQIVGVVEDIRARDVLAPPEPAVFFSHLQHPFPSGSALHITVEGDPARQVAAVERWLRRYEPHLAIVNVLTYRDVVSGSLYSQRMNAEMFTVLAAMALLLSAFGIFSVLSVSVGRRRREIGVRRALGARTSNVGWLMAGRAALPVLLGLALGLAGAAALGEVVEGLLYGVESGDPATLGGGIMILLVVALAAASGPVLKAVRVAPAEALKDR